VQAYTQELELKVSRLEEENERLRRQNVSYAVMNMHFFKKIYSNFLFLIAI